MTEAFTDDQVRIVDFPATPVAVMEHRGDPALIGDTLRRFIAWRKAAGLGPRTSATFNIFHSAPDAVETYRLDLCAATGRAVEPNGDGVIEGVIPAGRCAVLRQTVRATIWRQDRTFCTATGCRAAASSCATSPSSPSA